MKLIPVQSTNLRAVGYDPESHTLEIHFRSGGIYRYRGVPQSAFDGLLAATSKGRYFDRQIKNRYRFVKL
jgi:hypothetical protein